MVANTIYVLSQEQNKFYVGKTSQTVKSRFRQHSQGGKFAAAWTTRYKPIAIHEIRREHSQHDEDNVTIDYMMKYGLENVRGGMYSSIILPQYQINEINRKISSLTSKCFICNDPTHWSSNCPNRSRKRKRCTIENPTLVLWIFIYSIFYSVLNLLL